jgi:hypothetical protein
MTKNDYDLLIKICQYSLRKGYCLDQDQISDIDRMLNKLYNKRNSREKLDALVRNKKVGKTTGVRNS